MQILKHFLFSLGHVSGGIQTPDPRTLGRVFYHCAPGTQGILQTWKNSITPKLDFFIHQRSIPRNNLALFLFIQCFGKVGEKEGFLMFQSILEAIKFCNRGQCYKTLGDDILTKSSNVKININNVCNLIITIKRAI